jgi:hypothetical protein
MSVDNIQAIQPQVHISSLADYVIYNCQVPGWGQQAAALQEGSVLQQISPYQRRPRTDNIRSGQLDNAVRVYVLR